MDNWYLQEYKQKTYLHDKSLSFRPFSCNTGDHDHCELCWARFSKHDDDLHSGFYEELSKSWICEECYRAASNLFGWTVIGTD